MHPQEFTDSQYLLDQFWSDFYNLPEKNRNHEAVENLLKNFRKGLDRTSKTAVAIDFHDPIDEVIRCAEEEGFMEIAQLLRI